MIRAIMELALSQRIVVVGLAIALALLGAYSFSRLDIEAYPDPVQPMVEVLTLPTGLGASGDSRRAERRRHAQITVRTDKMMMII